MLKQKITLDKDVKIENYVAMGENNQVNGHDGEQLGFYEQGHIKTQIQKKDILFIFSKKQKISIYFTKFVLKRTSDVVFNMKKVDLDES